MRKNSIIKNILKLFSPYKKNIIVIIFTMVLTSLISIINPLFRQSLVDNGILQNDMKIVGTTIIIILLLSGLQMGFEYVQMINCTYISQMIPFQLYKKSFNKLLKLKITYFENESYYKIIENLRFDITSISTIADQNTLFAISQTLNVIGGIIGLTIISWKLTLLVIIAIPLKLFITNYFIKCKSNIFRSLMVKIEKSNDWLGDILNNIEVVKLWNLYENTNRKFIEFQQNIINSRKKNIYMDKFNSMSSNGIDIFLNIAIYYFGGVLIINKEITLGGFFAFLSYTTYVLGSISLLNFVKYTTAEIKPAYSRYSQFMQLDEEDIDSEKTIANVDSPSIIRFKNVSLSRNDKEVINNISFEIRKGEKVALWGENGSGKTSLINLLLRFYTPDKGEILIDNTNIENIDIISYRNNISVITQNTKLFNQSIHENVDPHKKHNKEEIIEAFQQWGMHDLIKRLNNRLDEKVGSNGSKLSGGEKQKLAAIRAYFKKGNILILDEPTANYDEESTKVFNEIINLQKDYNFLIIVTHEREILKQMDKIILMSNGKIDKIVTYSEFCRENP